MAEQVQAILDRMVPALRDLMDKEVFTESEVKAIVERRRESEYLLRRRSARKADYLRYIEAERNLEKLRNLRNKKVLARKSEEEREERKRVEKEGGKYVKSKSSSSIGDASIVQHIHLLYTRAKRKWKDDLSFHIQHAEFAKEKKSFSMLSKIYAEALQMHPRNTSLWIEAASHEYFGFIVNTKNNAMSGGGSIKSARVMLQRGLRVNPAAQDLWLQSFCLELHYIQKLRGRRDHLQLGLKKSKIVEDSDASDDEDDKNSNLESFFEEAKLPRIIYKNAIKAVPSDVLFRVKFLEQCKLFPQTEIIVDEIMDSIEEDFGEHEEAWIARAKFAVDYETDGNKEIGFMKSRSAKDTNNDKDESKSRKRKQVDTDIAMRSDPFEVLKEATETIQTPKMFMETMNFVKAYTQHACAQEDINESMTMDTKRKILKAGTFMKRIIEKIVNNGITTPDLVVEVTSTLFELSMSSNALQYIENIMNSNEMCKTSAKCWIKYADVKAIVSADSSLSCKVLRRGHKVIPLHDPGHRQIISKLFMNLLSLASLSSSNAKEKELLSLYDKILLTSSRRKEDEEGINLPSLSLCFLKYLVTKSDLATATKVYKKLIFHSNYLHLSDKTSEEMYEMDTLFQTVIALEKINVREATGDKQKRRNLSLVYDAAHSFFSEHGYPRKADHFTKLKNKDLVQL